MAYSSSIKRAQVQKLCELCETDPHIKWRCIQCNVFMCNKCKNIHLKVQTSVKHEIVDLKTVITDLQPKIITDNIQCGKHRKNCCLYCQSCSILVCPDCISSSHHSHHFEPIENVVSEKVDTLRKIQSKIQKDLSQCQAKVIEIQTLETGSDSAFEDSIGKIQLQERNLTDAISKYSKQIQDEIKVERSEVKKSLSEIKIKVEQEEKNLVARRDHISKTLASNQGKLIFDAAEELQDTSSVQFDPLPSETKQFSIGEGKHTDIPGLFGYLKISGVKCDIKFEVVKTVTTDLSSVSRLTSVDDTSAWISCPFRNVLRKIDTEQINTKIVRDISVGVGDIAKTPDNNILMSMYQSSAVKLLTETGEMKYFMSVSPLFVNSIHVTSENNIMASVVEQCFLYKILNKSIRAVYVYGMDRKLYKIYQFDKNKQRLFTCPDRITTTTIFDDILVIDRTSGSTGRVVELNKEGDVKWTYEGHPEINDKKQFNPLDIVSTTSRNVLVSDIDTHTIHILSWEGHVLSCKAMTAFGIKYPYSLDIDRKGLLWLGCYDDENRGAKIHIIKLK